jgi:hypothetical protein
MKHKQANKPKKKERKIKSNGTKNSFFKTVVTYLTRLWICQARIWGSGLKGGNHYS